MPPPVGAMPLNRVFTEKVSEAAAVNTPVMRLRISTTSVTVAFDWVAALPDATDPEPVGYCAKKGVITPVRAVIGLTTAP